MTNDDTECCLSALIYKGWIKGFISHGQALSMSKKEAFPDQGQVVEKNESKI